MRFVEPPNLPKRAAAYEGRNVRTTNELQGVVTKATIHPSGIVILHCETLDGGEFVTDNEHATIWEPRANL